MTDVALIGCGAIGGTVAHALTVGEVAGARHVGTLKTVKPAGTLGIDPDHVTEVFCGTARDAVRAHPRGLNVAASIALACGSWDAVAVHLLAYPGATTNSHTVEVEGDAGTYRIEAHNRQSPTTPTTSAVTVGAVLQAIGERTNAWTFA